jgi:hypothetical protein
MHCRVRNHAGIAAVNSKFPSLLKLFEGYHHDVTNQTIASMPLTPRPTGQQQVWSAAAQVLIDSPVDLTLMLWLNWYGFIGNMMISGSDKGWDRWH